MSRDYIDNPNEDSAFSLRRIDDSLARIADTLDDYMDLTLSAQKVTTIGLPPESLAALAPILDEINAVRERRAARR